MQHDLQDDDAGPGRHRPARERDAARRSSKLAELSERAAKVGVDGNREYNPGWHTALDLHNLLTVSEAITRSALERKESRGGHFRDDYPGQGSTNAAKFNFVITQGRGRRDAARARADPADAGRAAGRSSRRRSSMAHGDVPHLARRRDGEGEFEDYTDRGRRGHGRARRRAPDPGRAGARPRRAAGTARPASAARARPRSTASRG